MSKTAMQELIDYLVTQKGVIEPLVYGFLMHRMITAFEKEKQQIISARSTAPLIDTPYKSDYEKEAENYYNQTFKP